MEAFMSVGPCTFISCAPRTQASLSVTDVKALTT